MPGRPVDSLEGGVGDMNESQLMQLLNSTLQTLEAAAGEEDDEARSMLAQLHIQTPMQLIQKLNSMQLQMTASSKTTTRPASASAKAELCREVSAGEEDDEATIHARSAPGADSNCNEVSAGEEDDEATIHARSAPGADSNCNEAAAGEEDGEARSMLAQLQLHMTAPSSTTTRLASASTSTMAGALQGDSNDDNIAAALEALEQQISSFETALHSVDDDTRDMLGALVAASGIADASAVGSDVGGSGGSGAMPSVAEGVPEEPGSSGSVAEEPGSTPAEAGGAAGAGTDTADAFAAFLRGTPSSETTAPPPS
eukprot:gene11648-34357_t